MLARTVGECPSVSTGTSRLHTLRFWTGLGGADVLAFLASGCLSVSESDAPEMGLLELVSSSDIVSLLFGCEDDSPRGLLVLGLALGLAFLTFSFSAPRFERAYMSIQTLRLPLLQSRQLCTRILVLERVYTSMQHTLAAVFFF